MGKKWNEVNNRRISTGCALLPKIASEHVATPGNGAKIACSLPSVGDRSNIILRIPRSNHKEQGKFKDNVIK